MDERQLVLKIMQIQAVVAKQHGMGDLKDLSPGEYESVRDLTAKAHRSATKMRPSTS